MGYFHETRMATLRLCSSTQYNCQRHNNKIDDATVVSTPVFLLQSNSSGPQLSPLWYRLPIRWQLAIYGSNNNVDSERNRGMRYKTPNIILKPSVEHTKAQHNSHVDHTVMVASSCGNPLAVGERSLLTPPSSASGLDGPLNSSRVPGRRSRIFGGGRSLSATMDGVASDVAMPLLCN